MTHQHESQDFHGKLCGILCSMAADAGELYNADPRSLCSAFGATHLI